MTVYETPTDIPGRKVLLATAEDWLEIAKDPSLAGGISRLIRETTNGLQPEYALRITFLPEDAHKVLLASIGKPGNPTPPTLEAFVQPNGVIGVRPNRQ